MVTKICSTCKREKPVNEFYLRDSKPRKTCRQCCINASKYYKGASTKIFCPRGEGQEITKSQCYPGCNDACTTCKHFIKDMTIDNFHEPDGRTGVQSSAGYAVDMADKFYA